MEETLQNIAIQGLPIAVGMLVGFLIDIRLRRTEDWNDFLSIDPKPRNHREASMLVLMALGGSLGAVFGFLVNYMQ